MSIFQKSVVNKHLKTLDENKVNQAYNLFNGYFKNHFRLSNIMLLKEENYQEGFLRELFVDVLGYTINPNKDYNLTTEYKNLTDSKKADGAILKNNKAIGVIELKSTKLIDLKYIEKQAFNYKNNQPECRYVITSTFRFLRLYIDNSTQYEEFDLFDLDFDNFKRFYLFLSKESIFNNIPSILKEETSFHEENITVKFYKDYKQFKDKIFESLVEKNQQYDKILLFKKTQKLLDRVLFIAFAEDKGLIPPNALSRTIEKWKILKNEGDNFSLYSRYQLFFQHLNAGFTIQDWGTIPAYNGGLYAFDEILDNKDLFIDNKTLQEGVLSIAKYDFNTEIDVNILGHIFEHSLNELDEVEKILTSQNFQPTGKLEVSKRKKDGVFYTPDYITKYIVENTIGELCREKQAELNIQSIENLDILKDKKGKLTKAGKEIFTKLQAYKSWLFSLKILDPACGSGAFLIAALDFLIAEHKQTDDLMYQISGEALKLFDTDKTILEKNIYGVDINEESVEIAKLSLWLHTAKKERKLSDLSGNIKCGNSLIDNKEIAGEKAFLWQNEFSEIMQNGGFDVIVGNPPYVNIANMQDKVIRNYYQQNYKTVKNKSDLFSIFIERSYFLLKKKGFFSFIFPNSWMGTDSFVLFRKFLIEKTKISKLVKLPNDVFPDAVVTPIILVASKNIEEENIIKLQFCEKNLYYFFNYDLSYKQIKSNGRFSFSFSKQFQITCETFKLGTVASFSLGIKTSDNKRFILPDKKDDNCYAMIRGRNINRYFKEKPTEYIWYMPKLMMEKYGADPQKLENFLKPKILFQEITGSKIIATLDNDNLLVNNKIYILFDCKIDMHFLLTILNSKFITYWAKMNFGVFLQVAVNQLKEIPIAVTDIETQKMLASKAKIMLEKNELLYDLSKKFLKLLLAQFQISKITKKLQDWYFLNFSELTNEIKKQKKDVKASLLYDFIDIFEKEKEKALLFYNEISKTDQEIDNLVYQLYNLTPEEIQIVENAQ